MLGLRLAGAGCAGTRAALVSVLLALCVLTSVSSAQLTADRVDVALDPGHSSWDVGATGAGLREHELTLDLARRVQTRLEQAGYTVRLTREGSSRVAAAVPAEGTPAVETEQRARHAAAGAARVYLSIHFNGHPNPTLRGTETYFNSENFGDASMRLAGAVQQDVVAAIREADPQAPDRGIKEDLAAGKPYGHFFSLRGPFTSALIEVLFLSNAVDASLAGDQTVKELIADGISRGITRFLVEEDQP